MIDYLELLLDGQAQEEREPAPELEQNMAAVLRNRAQNTDIPAERARAVPGDNTSRTGRFVRAQAGPETNSGSVDASDMGQPLGGGRAWAVPDVDADSAAWSGVDDAETVGGWPADGPEAGSGENRGYETRLARAGAARLGTIGFFSLVRGQGEALSSGTGGGSVSGAPDLYRQMTRAGQAAVSLRQSARLLTVTETNSASPGPGAAELDEIFSRDARRYDGGFSLF